MNQKQLTINEEVTTSVPKSALISRHILVQILKNANEGHFLLKEKGRIIAEIGSKADSLHAEVNVLDTRCYGRALLGGSDAAGEAFVDGWWTSPNLTQVTRFFCRNLDMMDHWDNRFGWMLKPFRLLRQANRMNTRKQAKHNILAHYDLGNDLYQAFLDERMQYSSAVFKTSTETLAEAQTTKLTRICQKLRLSEKDHLLEVGSGWGGLAVFAAQHYGCRVTTTTISDKQYNYAAKTITDLGLGGRIKLLNKDYRLLDGHYDKIVSVEMIEAVGRQFLNSYFKKLNSLLKPNGLFMLQAITIADQRLDVYNKNEDFIQKHIFPGGYLPSLALISKILSKKTELVIRDVLDIGLDYAQTLAHWSQAFQSNENYVKALGYDDRFCKLWSYYLGYCEGGFREKRISAVQLLTSKAPHRSP